MPAWSFQTRFRFALLNGFAEIAGEPPPFPGHLSKRQTIRARRRDGLDPRPGERVRVWVAQRTPERELLGTTPPVRRFAIAIAHPGAIILEGHRLAPGVITRLAHRDGFEGADALVVFLEDFHGFPFEGFVFRW